VMEYLEGRALETLVRAGPTAPERAVHILVQMCDALDAAHRAGVVHRDLKPENVMLVRRGRDDDFVKLLDFGIAKLLSATSTHRTATGVILGTPEFMAPEQAAGLTVDGRADQYAVAGLAYTLLTGRRPFEGRSVPQLLMAQVTELPRPPHEVDAAVPRALSLVVMKALAKKPEDRFASMADLATALEAALAETAPRPPPPPRHVVQVDVELKQGGVVTKERCQDLSRAGCFIASEHAPPPLFTRVELSLPPLGALEAQVVRHVSKKEAEAWNMSPGFGLQFLGLSPEQREAVERLTHGLPVLPLAPQPTASQTDDPLAEATLGELRRRVQGDHYVVLALPPDAELSAVKTRGRELARRLAELSERPLSVSQQRQRDAAKERIQQAVDVLGHAVSRAEFDGARGNWRGVAACLAAGLRATELETLRQRLLESQHGLPSRVAVLQLSAAAHERAGEVDAALRVVEELLAMDPLNLELHHRWRALSRLRRP
ncbi:MAG: protein kinase domain-containing protein, partial [Myxococcota bacterium]